MVYLPFLFTGLSKAQEYIRKMCSIALVMVVSQGALSTTMWHRREICDLQESVPAFLFKTFLMEDSPDEHFLPEHIIPYYGSGWAALWCGRAVS
jgi:hypothetical protein